uniref:CAS1 domain-containing protein 1 n=1 Tax=Culex pipiens TaxID=7175 RepID=A0A8D8DS90_CULPI
MGSDTKISKAELFIQNLNASNAKKLALLMVLGFTLYHGFLHLRYGNDSCKWLLSDGRFKGDKEWQPFGCMLHKYTETFQACTGDCGKVTASVSILGMKVS